ncbi:trypsin-like isoform X3 [Megalops cyprinoides]|nr:trypsin-like isoform X3 [Megalops cyprinoides]XP_036387380.1 trypsin-like isoform X3 [Megalops cyprinoides]XP_036387382.1 trypsin-like isoform X3 [Megalops cyprinoides]XP_036387383.1 trypsin-like isoform X3 [Megalops cyprinoides]XP_036387384.1 trypsin-like isoform X3 [Megalops cyprinoides]
MSLLVLLWCLFSELLAVNCQGLIQGRIVGGYAPAPHSIKYIVSIQTTKGQHFCGGSLINRYWVLTAAHCNIGSDQMMVVAGDYSLSVFEGTEQYSKPQSLVPHPQYNKSNNNADIMLINLKTPVVLNSYVSIAPLPRQSAGVPEGRVCRVSGWGYTSSSGGQIPTTLRTVKLPIVSTAKCNSSSSFNGNITASMICAGYSAGGKDACKGDSGGPLVCEGRVYGVVSWGNGCADAKFPGVYTAVSVFRRWIDRTIYSSYSRCLKY